jgi:hypothetical protein
MPITSPVRSWGFGTFNDWPTQHGYTMRQSVQPDSRFWQFQLTEGGWPLGTSALLIVEASGWSDVGEREIYAVTAEVSGHTSRTSPTA